MAFVTCVGTAFYLLQSKLSKLFCKMFQMWQCNAVCHLDKINETIFFCSIENLPYQMMAQPKSIYNKMIFVNGYSLVSGTKSDKSDSAEKKTIAEQIMYYSQQSLIMVSASLFSVHLSIFRYRCHWCHHFYRI